MSLPLLDISHLVLRFGGVTALQDVSFSVESGALSAIIGPNGAGKTSLLNCISGVYRPQQGGIVFDGRDVHQRTGTLAGGVYWGRGQKEEIRERERVEEIIDFLEIQPWRKQVVHTLAYGLQ